MTPAPESGHQTGPALRLFGDVAFNGRPIPGPRAKALIVALALAHGRTVLSHHLIEEVWGMDAPRNATTALHTMVSRIRTGHTQQLIASATGGYSLSLAPDQVDFWAAQNLLDTLPMDALEAVAQLSAAQRLLDGDAAPGTADSSALDEFIAEARSLSDRVERKLAHVLLAAGLPEQAAHQVQPLFAAEPNDESLAALYIKALRATGQANAALGVYEKLSSRLRKELGTDPSPELRKLHQELLQEAIDAGNSPTLRHSPPSAKARVSPNGDQLADPLVAPKPSLGTLPTRQIYGLRAATDQLVGRTADLEKVRALMLTHRLTTILGTGGLGKTRMAFALANQENETGTKSVIVLELAGLRTESDIWLALADAVGIADARSARPLAEVRPIRDLRSRTLAMLANKPLLLVLDNCEHLIEAAALTVAQILGSCPATNVLATSRAPLSLAGEQLFQLRTLNHVDLQMGQTTTAAVELFNRRAKAARSSVTLDPAVIDAICRDLDGLPLAIELAAARVRMMSVEDIARRLRNDPGLLVNADKSAPERHRTLTAVINWSWELLDDPERIVLRRLAHFPSGFSLSAAVEVAGLEVAGIADGPASVLGLKPAQVEDALEKLVNQSLVVSFEDSVTGTVRFRILETVREFASQKLHVAGEVPLVDKALTRWAASFAATALTGLMGRSQVGTRGALTAEQENLVHVLRGLLAAKNPTSDPAVAGQILNIFAILSFYWSQQGLHTEFFEFSIPVLSAVKDYEPAPESVDGALFSFTIIAMTLLFFNLRESVKASIFLKRVLRSKLPKNKRFQAMARLTLTVGRNGAEEVLGAMRQESDPDTAIVAFLASALWAENSAEDMKARLYSRKAFDLAQRLNDDWICGLAADSLTQLYSQAGEPIEAVKWSRIAIKHMRVVGAEPDVWRSTLTLSTNLAGLGRSDEAQAALSELNSLPLGEPRDESQGMLTAVQAEIAFSRGEISEGLRHYRSVETQSIGDATRSAENAGFGPMLQLFNSMKICAEALYDPRPQENSQTAADASRLRRYILASNRLNSAWTDLPVLGTLGLSIAAWQLCLAAPGTHGADVGLELLALTSVLRSRQDQPVMYRSRHRAAAREKFGTAAVKAAQDRVWSQFAGPLEAAARFIELLSDPVFRQSPTVD